MVSGTLLPSTGNSELPAKLDVVRVDLQPSEQYKSVCLHNIIHTRVYTPVCVHVLAYTSDVTGWTEAGGDNGDMFQSYVFLDLSSEL